MLDITDKNLVPVDWLHKSLFAFKHNINVSLRAGMLRTWMGTPSTCWTSPFAQIAAASLGRCMTTKPKPDRRNQVQKDTSSVPS